MGRRRIVLILLASALAIAALWAARDAMGLELDPETIRERVAGLGVWAPIAFVALVTLRIPLGLPSQVVLIAGGLAFGTAAGSLYGALGLTLCALAIFLLSRRAGRETLERRFPARMSGIFDIASGPLGAVFITVGTGYPIGPIGAYHAVAGVAGMAIATFIVAAGAGSMIRALVFTFFGSGLVSGELYRTLLAVAALTAAAFVPLLFPRPRAWLRTVVSGPPRDIG